VIKVAEAAPRYFGLGIVPSDVVRDMAAERAVLPSVRIPLWPPEIRYRRRDARRQCHRLPRAVITQIVTGGMVAGPRRGFIGESILRPTSGRANTGMSATAAKDRYIADSRQGKVSCDGFCMFVIREIYVIGTLRCQLE